MKSDKEINEPVYFRNERELRSWFNKNHNKVSELWIGYYKKDSGIKSVTYPESVNQALCFGWIDGIRKAIDSKSYKNRFTPRKPNSNWSAVNIKRVEELKKLGLMKPAGLLLYEKRRADKSETESFEQSKITLSKEYIELFKKNKEAWDYFNKQAPYYKKVCTRWVMAAKKEETRIRRLEMVISNSGNKQRIQMM